MPFCPLQVTHGIGPISSGKDDSLLIGESMALVNLGSAEAGLIISTTESTPNLLLPPEGLSGKQSSVVLRRQFGASSRQRL